MREVGHLVGGHDATDDRRPVDLECLIISPCSSPGGPRTAFLRRSLRKSAASHLNRAAVKNVVDGFVTSLHRYDGDQLDEVGGAQRAPRLTDSVSPLRTGK
jgi:hypothetical protein